MIPAHWFSSRLALAWVLPIAEQIHRQRFKEIFGKDFEQIDRECRRALLQANWRNN